MSYASLCIVRQFVQRTSRRLINDYNYLQFTDLTTNQVFFETLHGVALKRFQNSLEISLNPVRLFYLSRCGLYDLVEASLPRPAITD